MRNRYSLLYIACCISLVCLAHIQSAYADIINGTLISPSTSTNKGFLGVDTGSKTSTLKIGKNSLILRGQVGKETKPTQLQDLAMGDQITAVVNQDGYATSLKAYFGIIKGVYVESNKNKLALNDGRFVNLSKTPQVVLPDGKLGKCSDLKPGCLLICRVNPITNEAWTVVATTLTKDLGSPVKVTPSPNKTPAAIAGNSKPKINSITYSSPTPLIPGNLITVDLSGTPNGKAAFEVKNLLQPTKMEEVSPGSYRAVVFVPKGKPVEDAPLIGHLTYKDIDAPPVQASRLIKVNTPIKASLILTKSESDPVKVEPTPQSTSNSKTIANSTPVNPPVAATPKKVTQPAFAAITITMPPNGAKIKRALMTKGNANPDSKVNIKITYTNHLTGLLELSGEVALQTVAVGNNGEFKMGPIALEGALATKDLEFTIKAYYPERDNHNTVIVKVIGGRE